MLRLPWISVLLVLVCAPSAQGATQVWPGAVAPCAGTLQACIDGSAAGDTVLVAQNALISVPIRIDKPLVLRAAEGYRPAIAAGFGISGTVGAAGVSWLWQVEGFDLQQGAITIQVSDGTAASIVIRNNRILQALAGATEVSVVKALAANTTLTYDISGNRLDYLWDAANGPVAAAVQVQDGGNGSSVGRIRENHIVARGDGAMGILVDTENRSHRSEVLGNWVLGGRSGSIYLRQGRPDTVSGGLLTGFVLNNVVQSALPGSRSAEGIKLHIFGGLARLTIWHNTVVDAVNGIHLLVVPTATASGDIRGNLLAYLASAGLLRSGADGVADRDNLFFASAETPLTPGLSPSSVFADPMLNRVPDDPHLRPGSAAINRIGGVEWQELHYGEGLPLLDGDGLRRLKLANTDVPVGTGVDIGALEAGDVMLLHRITAFAPGNVVAVDHPARDGFPGAAPQLLVNQSPEGDAAADNNHPLVWLYSTGIDRWRLRTDDQQSFSSPAAYNVFAPALGPGRYIHLNTTSNIVASRTYIGDPDLSGHGDRILLVSRSSRDGNSTQLTAPVAVEFLDGFWTIVRLDGLPMPADGGFNVYFQEPSSNAFRHRAGAGDTFGNSTEIDHPLLNGHRCALFQVGQALDGVGNNHQIGVRYAAGTRKRWAIFNQDQASMPAGALFHVVVDPQSVDCPGPLFADGFE